MELKEREHLMALMVSVINEMENFELKEFVEKEYCSVLAQADHETSSHLIAARTDRAYAIEIARTHLS